AAACQSGKRGHEPPPGLTSRDLLACASEPSVPLSGRFGEYGFRSRRCRGSARAIAANHWRKWTRCRKEEGEKTAGGQDEMRYSSYFLPIRVNLVNPVLHEACDPCRHILGSRRAGGKAFTRRRWWLMQAGERAP